MQRLVILIFWLLVLFLQSNGQSPAKKPSKDTVMINIIKAIVEVINEKSSNYNVIEQDIKRQGSEDGFAVGHFDGKRLPKIKGVFYGETGKAVHENYFLDGKLLFALVKSYNYNQPMYLKGSKINSVVENRYYFDNGLLLKWVYGKEEKSNKSPEFKKVQNAILSAAESLRKQIISCAVVPKTTSKLVLRCKHSADCLSTRYVLNGSRTACGSVIHVKNHGKKVPTEL